MTIAAAVPAMGISAGTRRSVVNPNVELVDDPKPRQMPERTLFVETSDIPWTPIPNWPGCYTKLLSFNVQTGRTATLFRLDRGARIPVHKHLSGVDIIVLKGNFGYGANIVGPMGFIYEPPGVIHEPEAANEEVVLFAVAYGPVQNYEPDGRPGVVGDIDGRLDAIIANGAARHLGF